MIAGTDPLTDLDLLRHGGMGRLTCGIRPPSTLGMFLRSFTFGHVHQLDPVTTAFLIGQADAPRYCPAPGRSTSSTWTTPIRVTHGYAEQGVGYGYTGVEGLISLPATICPPGPGVPRGRELSGVRQGGRRARPGRCPGDGRGPSGRRVPWMPRRQAQDLSSAGRQVPAVNRGDTGVQPPQHRRL
jgi:hypothetical protein